MTWVVRAESPADRADIHALVGACFPTDAEARLIDSLRAARRLTISLVAEDEGRILGHVAFSPVTAANGAVGLGLAPVAVAEAFRRRGMADELISRGLAIGREANYGWVVVLGEPQYYRRFGFQPARDWGLADEYAGGEAFQAIELKPGGLPRGAGLVRYAPEFAVFAE